MGSARGFLPISFGKSAAEAPVPISRSLPDAPIPNRFTSSVRELKGVPRSIYSAGKVKKNVAPTFGFDSTQILPA